MKHLPTIGRIFFAAGVMAIAIEHFIFQDFMIGRAPAWPELWPGKLAWAYVTGAVFFIAGSAILFRKNVRIASASAVLLIFLWAFLRHIPVVAASTFLSSAWTAAGKSLVFMGGTLAAAASFQKADFFSRRSFTQFLNLESQLITAGRVCLGIFLVICGIQHFMYTEFVASLIPEWFPGNAVFWTYFAGVTLITGGIGLFITKFARPAALLSGIMIFSWVWLVHLPRAMESTSDNLAIFEALAFSGIAFVLTTKD